MKVWTPSEEDPEFELTPMIDVVFLLIAFFMTLITFITEDLIELRLPQAAEATVPEETGERQYLSVDGEGQIYFGDTPVEIEQLVELLNAQREEHPDVKVFLRADAGVAHRYVNRVMAATAAAGIFDVIFASEID
jgi:biopolymer transport protein ExbD